ncbi:MAG TPA: hypothetical protein VLK35_12335 [Methylomirabilota bacterium]|nr:hypothetical protein [Methylomirabilota bacterium]
MTWKTSFAVVAAGPPASTTPGMPGVNDPTRDPTFPCPSGQARRPGSPVCSPTVPTPR